jgi:hypothetical protein
MDQKEAVTEWAKRVASRHEHKTAMNRFTTAQMAAMLCLMLIEQGETEKAQAIYEAL